MTRAVSPADGVEAEQKAGTSQAATAQVVPHNAGPLAFSPTVYEDSLAAPLPNIDIRKTLAAKLCGRSNDTAFNDLIIQLTRRAEPFVYAATALLIGSGFSLFLVEDLHVRTLASYVCGVCGLVFSVHIAASLLWDVLCLVVRTFDFWFLAGMNTVNTVFWYLLFHDARAVAMLSIGLAFTLTMAVDANAYTRRLSSRIYVLGPPTVCIGLALVLARYPPDLHYSTYGVRGVTIESVDLMANANLAVIFFMMVRGLRAWRLVVSRDPVTAVRCDVFVPVCRLTPQPLLAAGPTQSEVRAASAASRTTVSSIRRLQLEQHADGREIDLTKSLLPSIARVAPTHVPLWALNAVGVAGCACSTAVVVREVVTAATAFNAIDNTSAALGIIGFVASALFVTVQVAYFQPKLAKRVLLQVDAWYLSFQVTSTTAGMCDTIAWQPLGVLLFLTPWIWSHWTIFLDALPAVTRRRLGCSRSLIVAVTTLLMLYPILLGYYVYYSPARQFLRNRVLLEIRIGGAAMRMETFGFLASKLSMMCVWTARSLSRELSRPADAFKFIELNAYYNVN